MNKNNLKKLKKEELVKLIVDTVDIIEKRIEETKEDAEKYPDGISRNYYHGMQIGFEGALHILNVLYEQY